MAMATEINPSFVGDQYLLGCNIQGEGVNSQDLIDKLNDRMNTIIHQPLDNLALEIDKAIKGLFSKSDSSSWEKCEGRCYDILEKLVRAEIDSTAYMLRILCNAQINVGGSRAVNTVSFRKLSEEEQKLTGVWDEDKGQLELVWNEQKIIDGGVEENPPTQGILVFGLGPSGAGKTYWGKTLIDLLNESGLLPGGNVEPKCFLSIDGGKYREESLVYKAIVSVVQKHGGLLNLATKTLFNMDGRIIFDSDYIKNRLLAWLCIQKVRPNLYVPETLSSCDLGVFVRSLHRVLGINNCKSKIQKYIDITGDNNPIILHIWQHWDGEQCPFKAKYKCKGCEQSGHEREKKEGKKYPTYPLSYYTAEHSAKIEELLALDTKQPRILLSLHSSEQHDGVGGNNLLVNHSTYDDNHPYVVGFKLFKKKVKALEYNSKPILISLVNDDHIPSKYYETHLKPESSFFTKCLTVAAMLILFL